MNVQIVGLPGAGKTTLATALSEYGLTTYTKYRPLMDRSVVRSLLRTLLVDRKRITPVGAVLKNIDSGHGDAARECFEYWRACSEIVMSVDTSLEDMNALLSRLVRQIYIWGRHSKALTDGLYDDHFYQNILSFCALRSTATDPATLLTKTPHADVAILIERPPEVCLSNMFRRRRGPPRILIGKSRKEALALLRRCEEVGASIRRELPKHGVRVISRSGDFCTDELIGELAIK